VVKGFPRISETFITRELEALQDRGVRYSLASLRQPANDAGTVSHRVLADVNYLPEYLHKDPMRILSSVRRARGRAGFANAWRLFWADLKRDPTRNRWRRFGQACVLAAELPEEVRHLHAHFIHTPASVARYAAAIRGLSFSISAHAKDVWTTPDWDLQSKLAEAAFVCTCNDAAAERLASICHEHPPKRWPHLVIAGHAMPAQGNGGEPIRLLTVARAVPKKGLDLLIKALAQLPPEPAWTWTHIGGGPGLEDLKTNLRAHPCASRMSLLGARPHEDVMTALAAHDVFVMTPVVASDGDRDGRPNALIEAMSAGLACLSTPAGGVAELLKAGDGLIVDARIEAVAQGLARLLASAELRNNLGNNARNRAKTLRQEGLAAMDELEAALRSASGQ
jgi:glycosyltransferase involved in cell wall biosynthesis